jgi:hypothetical protein
MIDVHLALGGQSRGKGLVGYDGRCSVRRRNRFKRGECLTFSGRRSDVAALVGTTVNKGVLRCNVRIPDLQLTVGEVMLTEDKKNGDGKQTDDALDDD